MDKRMIDRFTMDFERNLPFFPNQEQSFKKAKEDFEEACGFTPYNNYNSYKAARSRDRNKFKRKK